MTGSIKSTLQKAAFKRNPSPNETVETLSAETVETLFSISVFNFFVCVNK